MLIFFQEKSQFFNNSFKKCYYTDLKIPWNSMYLYETIGHKMSVKTYWTQKYVRNFAGFKFNFEPISFRNESEKCAESTRSFICLFISFSLMIRAYLQFSQSRCVLVCHADSGVMEVVSNFPKADPVVRAYRRKMRGKFSNPTSANYRENKPARNNTMRKSNKVSSPFPFRDPPDYFRTLFDEWFPTKVTAMWHLLEASIVNRWNNTIRAKNFRLFVYKEWSLIQFDPSIIRTRIFSIGNANPAGFIYER